MPYADPTRRYAASRAWAERHPERCRAYANAHDARHRDSRREAGRRYRAADPAKVASIRRKSRLKQEYGLTLEGFDSLLVAQSGRCAICGAPMPAPVIDHDHGTGRVRKLLCSECNLGLGKFRDSPALLRAAHQYLKEHQHA